MNENVSSAVLFDEAISFPTMTVRDDILILLAQLLAMNYRRPQLGAARATTLYKDVCRKTPIPD
jgi:hypothetical protein